jgi:sortase A
MTVPSAQCRCRWIGALSLLVSLLIPGCAPAVNTPAEAPAGIAAVQAEPLSLLVLTPAMLPRRGRAVRRPPTAIPAEAAMDPTPSPGSPPSPTTVTPSSTPTFTPPVPTPRPPPSWTVTSAPTPTPTYSPTATHLPRPAADRAPDRIVAPAIGLDAPVIEIGWHLAERNGQTVSEWDVADHAAGFHKGSAYPGRVGNTVLSGHHNIRGEVFRYLIELQFGDLISLYAEKQEYRYTVQQVLLIPEKNASSEQRRENARWIGYFSDERLTLVTCWPYNSNTHRVIVIAYPAGGGS